jgi:hypothetical protein
MSAYAPPSNSNSTFNNTNFNYQNNLSSSSSLDALYVKYPITQGSVQVKGNLSTQGNVNITGTLTINKPITAPTTWTAPVAGQIGYTITGLNTNAYSITSGTTVNMSSVFLSIGVWYIQYLVNINTLPTVGTVLIGLSPTALGISSATNTVMGGAVSTTPAVSGSYVVSMTSPASYYLLTTSVFTTGTYVINTGSYTLTATRIA